MSASVITEVNVTSDGMWVGHHVEFASTSRGPSRTLVWSRLIAWDTELHIRAALCRAEWQLLKMGLRPIGDKWWADIYPDTPIAHRYAVLERIPGSDGTWQD